MSEKKSYLIFIPRVVTGTVHYNIYNLDKEYLGRIVRVRVGQWMSWCLFLNTHCYMSASCLDETREKIRELNNKNKRGDVL